MKYDLVGRRCVVTGASSGVGREIARNLAYFGATVVLICRDRDRGSEALQDIAEDSGNDHITLLQSDLSDGQALRQLARNILAGQSDVHVLVNNASTWEDERRESSDGHELTFATNTLAPFVLTNLLYKTLARCAPSRVINVASSNAGGLDLSDLEFAKRRYSARAAYMQSKQALLMLTWALSEKADSAKVSVHACHPGPVDTPVFRAQRTFMKKLFGRSLMHRPSDGALTATWLAADPAVHEIETSFWADRKAVRCRFKDDEDRDELWAKCVEMTRANLP